MGHHQPIGLIAGPEWWEKVIIAVKVRADGESRSRFAAELQSQLNSKLLKTRSRVLVRAGVAGRTTIIVAPREVDKALALREIRASKPPPDCLIYIGDEFTKFGNDAVVLTVNDVIRVAVDRCQDGLPPGIFPIGTGPSSTFRFLRVLALTSVRSNARAATAAAIAKVRAHREYDA